MIIVIADVDEVAALLGVTVQRDPEIVRPQESGPCVHCEDGTPYRCTYPYDDSHCPHLDDPAILCPVKGACYAMSEVARMRDVCEAEKAEQDADMTAGEMVYETGAPEWVEPGPDGDPAYVIVIPPQSKRKDGWSEDEMWVIARADAPAEAVAVYRFRFPDSTRTDRAIKARWKKLRGPDRQSPPDAPAPTPDFAGDQVPVTQCEEPAGKGLYGDARALHADMMDGMMCDRPIDACEPIVRGDRVALVDDPGLVGTAVIVNVRSKFASVEFPGDRGLARVYPLSALRRVIA